MKLYIFSITGQDNKTFRLTFYSVDENIIDYLNLNYPNHKKIFIECVEVGKIIKL